MPGRHWILVGALAVVVVTASLWYQRSAPQPAPLLWNEVEGEAAPDITVHVSGEVVSPGLVTIPAGSRVADAVAAAAGTTRDADLSRLNLAAPVSDGQQVVVAGIEEHGDAVGPASDGRVNVNTATAAELEQLPGVGPVLAGRIAAFREENGPFAAVEDLLDVPGIGEGKLETMRDSVVIP